MSPQGVTKVFNAKNNKHSIFMVILIGENGFLGGMGIRWPFACIYMTVPYLVDNSWPSQDKIWP